VAGAPTGFYVQAVVNVTLGQYQQQAGFFLQRGLLLLLEGKIAEAETRLKQAVAPQGLPLPSFFQERRMAERYLKMIEVAKSKP
jgi:hypothetical protein